MPLPITDQQLKTLADAAVQCLATHTVSGAATRDILVGRNDGTVEVYAQGGGGDPTLRTLQALAQLNAARNNLAGTFIRYEQLRVQLLLNLESLTLDDRGLPTNAVAQPDPAPK